MMSNEIIASYLYTFIVGAGVGAIVITVIESKWSVKSLLHKLKPERNTPLQKEIRVEERTIKQLEAQKADIRRLEELRRKREVLFEEVQESEVEREEVLVICDSCGGYMDYFGIDRSRREVYECKDCNLTLKAPLCTN